MKTPMVAPQPCHAYRHHRGRQIHRSNDCNIQAGAAGMNYVPIAQYNTITYTASHGHRSTHTHTHSLVWTVSSDNNICSISIQRCAGVMFYENKMTRPTFLLTANKMITLSLFVFSVIRASVSFITDISSVSVCITHFICHYTYKKSVSVGTTILIKQGGTKICAAAKRTH